MTTIYDIAKRVGCAPSTVSKYITKHGYVSDQLGKRIATAMAELDYHYNGIARALSTNSNNRIGVMVPFLDHPYFQGLVNAICSAAATADKEVTIFTTEYAPAKEEKCLADLEHRMIDSLIVTSHALPAQQSTPAVPDDQSFSARPLTIRPSVPSTSTAPPSWSTSSKP